MEMLRKKEEAADMKRQQAADRKANKKKEVFAKRSTMESERRAVREGEVEQRKAAAAEVQYLCIQIILFVLVSHQVRLLEAAKDHR